MDVGEGWVKDLAPGRFGRERTEDVTINVSKCVRTLTEHLRQRVSLTLKTAEPMSCNIT